VLWKKAERLFQNFPENQSVVNNVRVAMATADLEVSRSKVIDLLFVVYTLVQYGTF
jgi:hypothetical protein